MSKGIEYADGNNTQKKKKMIKIQGAHSLQVHVRPSFSSPSVFRKETLHVLRATRHLDNCCEGRGDSPTLGRLTQCGVWPLHVQLRLLLCLMLMLLSLHVLGLNQRRNLRLQECNGI